MRRYFTASLYQGSFSLAPWSMLDRYNIVGEAETAAALALADR